MTLSESYDILVTLVLPDINADWNIEESSVHLQNWATDMKHIANFTISSQIIYHPTSVSIESCLVPKMILIARPTDEKRGLLFLFNVKTVKCDKLARSLLTIKLEPAIEAYSTCSLRLTAKEPTTFYRSCSRR